MSCRSDGTQPHRIIIEFAKRTAVTVRTPPQSSLERQDPLTPRAFPLPQHISLWLNVIRDDSYTPTKILVEAGTDYHDLTEVRCR